jgi:acyl dehydratase
LTTPHPSRWPLLHRGSVFEDHVVGRTFRHHWGRTVNQSDNVAFSTQMLAFNPSYFNRDHAQREGRPGEIVNPLLVFAIVFGLSVEDLSEGGGFFLGARSASFHRDVYPGETLYATSTVIEARESGSRPNAGIVTWHTTGHTATGETVIDFHRTNLVHKRGPGDQTPEVPDGFAEDFSVGQRFRHARTRTVTDLDLNGLTLTVMNTADAHFSEQAGEDASLGGRINFGGLTLALTVGLATQDTAAQAVREVGLDDVTFAVPVRHGDTIGASSEVLAVDPHEAGGAVVTFRHYGVNQRREIVCQTDRSVHLRSRDSSLCPSAPTIPTTAEEI